MKTETLSHFLDNGGTTLLARHFAEVDGSYDEYQGLAPNPDLQAYYAMEAEGTLHIYTHRTTAGELVAYMVVYVIENPKYRSRMAYQDLFFVRPDYRGIGHKLLAFAESELKAKGVIMLFQNTKVKSELYFGHSLKKNGYALHEEVYVKRLDLTHGDSP
jgi:GNAT superfamily N-acetyltransferase